jgi:hypothetical protein
VGQVNERIDDVLREIASVEATDGFSARVRERLDRGGAGSHIGLPLLATAAALLLLAAGVWLSVKSDNRDTTPEVQAGRAVEGPAQTTGTAPGGQEMAAREAGPSPSARSVRPVGMSQTRATRVARHIGSTPPDHERALPALSGLDAIGPASLPTVPLAIREREIGALRAIEPIDIPALNADEGDRR